MQPDPHVVYQNETIVAIATPPGRGGIGIVRVSGPDARAIVERVLQFSDGSPSWKPWSAALATLPDSMTRPGKEALDAVMEELR